MEEDNVLFVRGGDGASGSDDVWDDTVLIKAYDKAINLAKEEVSKRLGVQTENKQKKSQIHKDNKSKSHKKWHVGSPCQAIYSEDGEYYEAIVSKIFENNGTCLVKFIGYNNIEKVELSALVESDGLQSQIAQQKKANGEAGENVSSEWNETPQTYSHKVNGISDESMDCDPHSSRNFGNLYVNSSCSNPPLSTMPPAPPLPPQLMARLPENDADALSSMLMSWYISGFHTGYYHGLKESRKHKQDPRKK